MSTNILKIIIQFIVYIMLVRYLKKMHNYEFELRKQGIFWHQLVILVNIFLSTIIIFETNFCTTFQDYENKNWSNDPDRSKCSNHLYY